MRPGQFHVALCVLEGLVAQPLLQHGDRHAPEHAVTAVGVPQGVGMGPLGVVSFITWLRRHLEMSNIGFCRSLLWNDARSCKLSTRLAGTGTSRPLLLGESDRTTMIGGS